MKKLYSRSLFAFLSCKKDRIKALKIFFLALALSSFGYSVSAQVVVTPANDTGICAQTATNGSAPGCTTLGIITINETLNTDFAIGTNQIVLNPPSGWQFCVAPPPVISMAGGGDVTLSSFTITASALTINTSTAGTLLHDMLTITGLRVQPILTSSVNGSIIASSVTGIAGITSGTGGTTFGRLGMVPMPILGLSNVCVGSCITLTSSPGVVWTSSNPALATVTPLGGDSVRVCGVSASVGVTITATSGACFQTKAVAVNALPTSMLIGDSTLCAWYDSTTVISTPNTGLYFSTGVTTYNLGSGNGKIRANAPGVYPVTYTLPTGCSITKNVTVNANPYPIMPDDLTAPYFDICRGSTRLYTCVPGGGTWATATVGVATVTTVAGDGSVLGVGVGTTKLIYTAPVTGCKTDTTITINPLPTPITGDTAICEGETTTLASGPCGGTWSVVTGTVALKVAENACADTAVFLGIGAGTTVILYTLPTGCAQITTLTVNPLPGTITGSSVVCEGDSVLLSSSSGGGTWVSSDPSVATIDSVTGWLKGVDSGVVTILYRLPTGCSTTFSATVNPLPTLIVPVDSVCEGSSITLTGLPSGGTWSSSTSAATVDAVGVVTGVSAGVTTITYALPTGCFVTKDVTVNPKPGPISGPTRVCVGDVITLSNGTSGGLWTSLDSFTLRIVDTSGVATGVAPSPSGTTIRYTVGACFVSYIVTVDPVPPGILGPLEVCMGDTATYTNTLPGGVWSSADTTLATIDSFTGVLTGVAAGTVTITYTTLGDCFAIYSVIINNKEPILGASRVCQGDTIHLSNANLTGVWTHTSPLITILTASGGTAVISGTSPGVDTIIYTTGTLCVSKNIVTVDPLAPISALTTSVCVGFTDSVWNVVPGGVWSILPGSKAAISSTGFITTFDTGVVIVTYTTPAGCEATIAITINPNPSTITGDSVVCMGQMITLASLDTGGIWTSSNNSIATVGTSDGIVTGVAAGTVTITYSFPTSCYTTKTITVNPLSPILGDSILCVGDTVILMDTTSGGVFSISPGTYASINALTGQTIALSGYGVETVYYTLPTGCQAALQITVNPLPLPIVGRDSVCQADTIMLSDPTPLGTWSSRFGLTIAGAGDGVILGVSVGIDSIYYTLPTGCRIGKPVVVNLTPAPIAGPSQVCLGRYISLSDATPGGYWTSGDPSVASVTAGGVVNGLAIDTTSIYYTLPVGSCRAARLITVQPIPVIVVNPNPSPIKCKYASVVLTATGAVSTGSTAGTYTWVPTYALSTAVGAVVVASPTITTTYTVTGINPATGCDSFTTVTVLVDDSLNNMKIVGDSSICEGECSLLMGSGRAGTFYNWHPSVGLSCTICDTVRACPDTSTTYWAVAIDDLGCKDSVSFRVNVHPIPVIRTRPNPAIVCRGRPLQLWAYSTNTDTLTNTYTWKPNLFISCDTCHNPIINDTANIVYRVTGTTIYGCYDSFDVKVSVLDTNVNTISNDTNICLMDAALLIATSKSLVSNLDVPTFTWLPNDGSLSNPDSSATLAFPTSTQTYSVAIRENACFSDTLSVTVFVEPYPTVSIQANAATNIVAGSPVQLIASAPNVAVRHYAWAPANTLSCDSCFNPVAIPVGPGPTTYTLTVTSIYGCTATDTITFNLNCDREQVFIPNTFTPNGDGVNDRFYVSGKGIDMITLFQVYNRWGQLVYEQRNIQPNDPSRGWDATFKGLVLQPDVFTYIVKARCNLGNDIYTYTGDISIVR